MLILAFFIERGDFVIQQRMYNKDSHISLEGMRKGSIMATQSYQMTETIEKNSSVLYTLSKTTSSPYS